MNRVLYLTLMSLLLLGCPATFSGHVKNESRDEIVVVPPFETELSWTIASGDEEKVSWYQECITIKGPSGVEYFSGWPIPDNVISNGFFSSNFTVVYKESGLFFKDKEGQLIKIKKVAGCSKA